MKATEDLVDVLARLRLSTEEEAGNIKRKAYSRKNRKRREEERTNNLYKFSREDELRLAAAFGRGSNEEILATKFNIPIHRYPFYFFRFIIEIITINRIIIIILFGTFEQGGTYDCCSPRSGSTTRSSTTT